MFGFTSNENTAMDRLFEGRFPSWVRFCSSDDPWVTKALLREGGGCIGKLACGEKRILKTIGNTKLK